MCGDNFVSDARTAAALAGEPTAQERPARVGWSYVLAAAQHLDPFVMPFPAAEDRERRRSSCGRRVDPRRRRSGESAPARRTRVGVEALIAELGPVARGFVGAMERVVWNDEEIVDAARRASLGSKGSDHSSFMWLGRRPST